jgi:malate dehydrogenase (oxaloacetate-decarboxylating)
MDDWEVFPREAAAVAMKAIEQGLARLLTTYDDEFETAKKIISRSRKLTQDMMENGYIAEAPNCETGTKVDIDTIKSAY